MLRLSIPCLMSDSLSTGCSSAAVRAVVGGWPYPPLFFSLFEQDVSRCERVDCFRNCATLLNTRCTFHPCVVALLCFDEGLYRQVINGLHDGEEDAKVLHWLDQLANHAQSLQLRVVRGFPARDLWCLERRGDQILGLSEECE